MTTAATTTTDTAGTTSAATRPPVQFTYRSSKELVACLGPPTGTSVGDKQTGNIRAFVYSKDGRYLAWATPENVQVVDAISMQPICEIARTNVLDLVFSPRGNFLSTWERFVKREGDEPAHRNMTVWEAATGTEVTAFTQRNQSGWSMQWTHDEEFCARLVTNEIHLYHVKQLANGTYSPLRLEGIANFSVSPGKSPSIAAFVPERKGAPASIRVFSLTDFQRPKAIKTFFRADNVQMYWNHLGTHLLVLTQTDVDKTGKSYYGETGLYYLAVSGNYDCRVTLDKEGPVHDVAWSPNSKEFVVVYGFMPAKATLFDHRANAIHDFGTLPRNYVQFSPHGRFICLAGFGNLAGTIDIWDRKRLTKLSTIDGNGASVCDWCPDDRHLMTAILSPRLRVDNGYKVWHYRGVLVQKEEIPELYQIAWRPAPATLYPVRNTLSPAPKGIEVATSKAVSSKPVGVYRPPGARAMAATPGLNKVGGGAGKTVPGMAPKEPEGAAAAAGKGKKKKDGKKKGEVGA
ncbi:eukaryotic translation initiation factor eIF2A-domain-containing protein [Syncephalis pseudoplumigaleata]|uniref:Eukaryotic translation initiation factor 2A n=1 Tax=Syncephalis pseudoplumigaleata TaxID=1712513 RepID=A0A4P9Z5X1_9FUNG|nr:eukaryotic translation initiation factor eIF2A-domain-containing protein [Syncephalis pseudoplumigaleata]|eukprot:RKP27986.1 eukaryotic translation initiation factor eIF2A-domain-containing protein [Syncephalis pseudoplumigaleata]